MRIVSCPIPGSPLQRTVRAAVALAALALLYASPAAARDRIDLLLLAGGDRVTGEIIRLEGANLSVRTLNLGTVDIDWPDVQALISVQLFEVLRADGIRFVGRLDQSEDGARMAIHAEESGEIVAEIPLAEVIGLKQVGTNLWSSRRGYVDLGWNYSNAASSEQLTLGAELTLQSGVLQWTTVGSSYISNEQSASRRERDLLQSTLSIALARKFLLLGYGSHERNDDLDLESRETVGAGVAWVPLRSARGRFAFGPGVQTSRESYFSREDTSVLTSAVVRLMAELHTFGRYGTRASAELSWIPLLSGPTRNRFEFRGSVRQKLGSDFNVSLSPYYSYDSNPPSGAGLKEDWGVSTSLGLLF